MKKTGVKFTKQAACPEREKCNTYLTVISWKCKCGPDNAYTPLSLSPWLQRATPPLPSTAASWCCCCWQQEPSCCFHQQQKLHWDAGHTPSQITLLGRGFATGPMKERTLLLSLAQCCANVEDAGTALSQRKDLPVAVQLFNPLRIVHVPLVVSPNPSGFTLRSRTPGAIQYGNTPWRALSCSPDSRSRLH